MRGAWRAAAVCAAMVMTCASAARAAGIDEYPEQGARALGRGGAFTARADDATAVSLNVAGLARQRGTTLLASANVSKSALTFARAGRYPDDPKDPATPWGGRRFPRVENAGGPYVLPSLYVATDLGLFETITIGAGVFGPSVSARTYPQYVAKTPSPSRYDAIQSDSTVLFPTLAAAWSVARWLDVGAAAHLVVGDFDELSMTYADVAKGMCKTAEDARCDALGHLKASGMTLAASVGAIVHASDSLSFGAQLRSPSSIRADGQVTSETPRALPAGTKIDPAAAMFTLGLPAVLRTGVRYAQKTWDVELDAIWEGFGHVDDPSVTTGGIALLGGAPQTITIVHAWHDTLGVRIGGSWETEADAGTLSLRAGAFYDGSPSDDAHTRLDFDTLPKLAGTLGFGFRRGAFSADVAYAGIRSIPRVVSSGALQPSELGTPSQPPPAVNDGVYEGFTHVFALSVSVRFDALFRSPTAPAKRR